MLAVNHVESWAEQHKAEFAPPVCNKLMHRDQLTVMFVGGPNTRTDFHLDQVRAEVNELFVESGRG